MSEEDQNVLKLENLQEYAQKAPDVKAKGSSAQLKVTCIFQHSTRLPYSAIRLKAEVWRHTN